MVTIHRTTSNTEEAKGREGEQCMKQDEDFTGGIYDEFDQIWEEDEEQRRQQAQFEAWYWELD